MNITCPNCGARYRLADAAVTENTRMRCAACNHRWVVGAAVDAPVEPEPEIVPEPVAEAVADDVAPRETTVMRTIVALVLGAALAIAATALWLARIDPAAFPVVGDDLVALSPVALPLTVTVRARTTMLASGDRLLEIDGTVKNVGTAAVVLPDLEARLAGPDGTVRRWRIAAPTAKLAPGASVGFVSTATGFPAGDVVVGIRPAG